MGQNARLRPLGLGCCVLGVMAVPGCFELRPDRLEISVHEDYAGAITKELLPPRFNGGFGFPGPAPFFLYALFVFLTFLTQSLQRCRLVLLDFAQF